MGIWQRLFGDKNRSDLLPAQPATTPLSPHAAAKDRVVRVFVSSTFLDMIEDRNELMAQVWPPLRKECRARGVEFVEVDLRWGVTEQQSQRQETLRHCLAEIKRCRPYFIGLLGERYGWVPGPDAYPPALLDEEKWLRSEVAKHSVTELEILHGVLNDPDMAGRAFFYFRDPNFARDRGDAYQAESAAAAERQRALKDHIKTVCEVKRIPLREGYSAPRALAALILKDLTEAIDAEFPADQQPDTWAREDRDHEAYAKSRRTEFYVGRDSYIDRLDAFARDGASGAGLIVLGESGGGKSALLANWVALWRKAHPNDFVFQHYIGSSPMSAGHLALMRRLMVAIARWCADDGTAGSRDSEEAAIPARAEEIVRVFPDYLGRLTARAKQQGVRAVVVLDALNQLEDRERGRLLAWLPQRLPGDLRLVVSTLPGDTLDALKPRGWPALTVEPLTAAERVRLIARYLQHFSQALSETRATRIAAGAAASNPLYLKTLLDDLRATGAHDRLDAQIDDYLKAPDLPALFGKILVRYQRDYERDCPGLVREALALLWAARRGLTEAELLELLKPAGQERLPAALWSPVRCALEDGLVDRDGVLAFAHEHLRVAVETAFVSDEGQRKERRLRLADYFEVQPASARSCDELPWLLSQTKSVERLKIFLLDIERFLRVKMRDENELLGYWITLGEERSMGRAYLESFERWANSAERDVDSDVAHHVAEFLLDASVHAYAEPLMRRALEIKEQHFGQHHPGVARELTNLARLLQATNRFGEAEPLTRRALEIDEQSLGKNHPNVAAKLNDLALLLQDTNRFTEAEPLLRRALEIDEQSLGENHLEVARTHNNLARLLRVTNRFGEAEPLMRRALEILEQSLGKNHLDVAKGLNNLAQLLQDTNRFTEAEPLMRRTLEIFEQNLGNSHPEVAKGLNNLAQLLQAMNRLGEVEPLMRRALEILEQSLGKNHPQVATALSNLALLLQATSRSTEAEPLIRRALEICEQSFGKNHPEVAIKLNTLAVLLRATNRFGEAEPLMRRALEIYERSLGKNHPDVGTLLNNLAYLLQVTNRFTEAELLMRRALEIFARFTRDTGHPHPFLQGTINRYADLLRAMGRGADEIQHIILTNLGERHGIDVASTSGRTVAPPSAALQSVIEQLNRDPTKAEQVLLKLQRENPALLQELIKLMGLRS
jgi:nephrocystin-3